VIFYTLKGPSYHLEIHDTKILLIKKSWWKILSFKPHQKSWEMQQLSAFRIAVPKQLLWGKLEWECFDGTSDSFHFSTNAEMVARIEKYFQKVVIRNQERREAVAIQAQPQLAPAV
jgi:hypothetical protein